jgi:hypothetical protein
MSQIKMTHLHHAAMRALLNRGWLEHLATQVRILKPDLAVALTWWTINFPSFHRKVLGNTTMNLQKFDDGWKIVTSHSSTNTDVTNLTEISTPYRNTASSWKQPLVLPPQNWRGFLTGIWRCVSGAPITGR